MYFKLIIAVALISVSTLVYSDERKDVADPVLKEVVTSFDTRMPRFVNKYGQSVFVADEPVTRGSLILAIYEYDKSIKIPKSEPKTESKTSITQMINDIKIKMPGILDDSLGDSKIFSDLKEKVLEIDKTQKSLMLVKSDSSAKNNDTFNRYYVTRLEHENVLNGLKNAQAAISKMEEKMSLGIQPDEDSKLNVRQLIRYMKLNMTDLKEKVSEIEKKQKTPLQLKSGQENENTESSISRIEERLSIVEDKIKNGISYKPQTSKTISTLTEISFLLNAVAAFILVL